MWLNEIINYMNKYLIVIGVDMVLLDREYRSNSPTINSVVRQLTNEEHELVINSDRAIEDLQAIADFFEIRGPLIGEDGCFIYYQNEHRTLDLVNASEQKAIDDLKAALPAIVSENFPEAEFIVADTTDFNRHLDIQELPENKKYVFALNKFRRHSISCHIKRKENGILIKDLTTAERFCEKVRYYCREKGIDNLKIQQTESFGHVLAHPSSNSKQRAFERLVKDFPKYLKIVITDDLIDKPALADIDYLFVVGNADEAAKTAAKYVSPERITKGVEDILLKIDVLTG